MRKLAWAAVPALVVLAACSSSPSSSTTSRPPTHMPTAIKSVKPTPRATPSPTPHPDKAVTTALTEGEAQAGYCLASAQHGNTNPYIAYSACIHVWQRSAAQEAQPNKVKNAVNTFVRCTVAAQVADYTKPDASAVFTSGVMACGKSAG